MDRLKALVHTAIAAGKDPYAQVQLNVGDPNAIRLLEILPKSPNESDRSTISCRLHLASVNDEYTALSYMWSQKKGQKSIRLNGIRMLVGRNLWDFLRQKRMDQKRHGAQLLWIDALCINQAGLAERNHQVAMMGKIYSQAYNVLIWLGLQRKLVAVFKRIKMDMNNERSWKFKSQKYSLSRLECLSYHEYWRRAWILQECVLAAWLELQCGPHRIPERHISELYESLMNTSSKRISGDPFFQVFKTRGDWYDSAGRKYLQPFMHGYGELPKCSDPRDRIYSKLALLHPTIHITPDYSKSGVDIFKEVVEKCLAWDVDCGHNLSCLAYQLGLTPEYRYCREDGWHPEIEGFFWQAQIFEDYFGSHKALEQFFGEEWDDYVRGLPMSRQDWLQTSRRGQQLPASAHHLLQESRSFDLDIMVQRFRWITMARR